MMKKNKFTKFIIAILSVTSVLLSSTSVYAEDDEISEFDSEEEIVESNDKEAGDEYSDNELAVQRTELDWFEYIMNKSEGEPFNPYISSKDPFKALVEKKMPAPPRKIATDENKKKKEETVKPQQLQVKPINIEVKGIVGNDNQRLAIINFENSEYTVMKDQNIDDKFKVIDIQNDRITVYSNKEQKRRSFKIDKD